MGFIFLVLTQLYEKVSGEGNIMAVSYRKLWIELIERNMNKTALREESGITTNALAALGKDERVTTDVLNKI